jgi:hypothetical protein
MLGLAMPWTYSGVLVMAGLQIVAFVCALDALLAFRRFRIFGRIVLVAWFTFMLVLTPFVLWHIGSIRAFGLK